MPTVLAIFDDEQSLTHAQDTLANAPFRIDVKQVTSNANPEANNGALTPPGAIPGAPVAGSNLPGGAPPAVGVPAVTNLAGRTAPTGVYNTVSGYDMNEEETAYVEQALAKGASILVIETDDAPNAVQLLRQQGAQKVIESNK
jgi:hypothetical protein